jgi:hypothetical protein
MVGFAALMGMTALPAMNGSNPTEFLVDIKRYFVWAGKYGG